MNDDTIPLFVILALLVFFFGLAGVAAALLSYAWAGT